jgi:hypothetical protein
MKKIQVYSSITANYDKHINDNRRLFLHYSKFKDPRLNAKIYKILPHYFMDTDFSIWIDGNVRLNCKPELLIDMMEDKDIMVFRHPNRNCIYQEAAICKKLKLDDEQVIDTQMNRYKELKWSEEMGLGSCRIIVRRHVKNIETLNCKWWAEITSSSIRDQLSFPIVFDKNIKYIEHPDSYDNQYFTVLPHRQLNWIQRKMN